MAEFQYNANRMSALLRLAPWIDLPAVREEVLGRLSDMDYRESTVAKIKSYTDGAVPTLPDSYSVQDEIIYAVHELYQAQQDSERRYYDAVEAIKTYFTVPDYWLRISE